MIDPETEERTCAECGEPILMADPSIGHFGPMCGVCASAPLPDLSALEVAQIGVAVLNLLRELDENTLVGLRANGLTQTAADAKEMMDQVWESLETLLANGANAVYREALGPMDVNAP